MAMYRKLSRTSSQRKALLRNQVTNLLYYGKIVTTEAKAKEVIKMADTIIALAVKENGKTVYDTVEKKIKKDSPSRLHARRKMLETLYTITVKGDKKSETKTIDMANYVFDEVAPKYATRNGGYTRIIKIGPRKGDNAMEVVLELV